MIKKCGLPTISYVVRCLADTLGSDAAVGKLANTHRGVVLRLRHGRRTNIGYKDYLKFYGLFVAYCRVTNPVERDIFEVDTVKGTTVRYVE